VPSIGEQLKLHQIAPNCTKLTENVSDQETFEFLKDLEEAHSRPVRQTPRRSKLTNFFDGFQAASGAGFRGGQLDRITDEWNPGQIGPNASFRQGGKRLRERARELYYNNPLARSAVNGFIRNVMQQGITPRPQFDDTDRRKAWAAAWNRWAGLTPYVALAGTNKRECDITGESTLYELHDLWLFEIIVAGGCLKHYVELNRRGRTLPLAIELIPEERFADHVTSWGRNPKTANPVEDGIEYNLSTGRVIAYHVLPAIIGDSPYQSDIEAIRLPAVHCEYSYFKTRTGQRRGHTMLHAALNWIWSLGWMCDNELTASQIKSNWAYMILSDLDPDLDDLNDSDPETGNTDAYGNPLEKVEPGMVARLPKGSDIKSVGPNVPQSESLPWLMLIQRSIAVAMETTYEELTSDYTEGNMSSVRMSAESARKTYRRMQRFTMNHCLNPDWGRFVVHASRAGLDGFPSPADLMADLDTWLGVKWSTGGWASPNPVHDAQAAAIRKASGHLTDLAIVEGDGGDLDEHYDQLEYEAKEKQRRGIIIPDEAEEQQNLTEDALRREEDD
jgi:lambda family phage portal protein